MNNNILRVITYPVLVLHVISCYGNFRATRFVSQLGAAEKKNGFFLAFPLYIVISLNRQEMKSQGTSAEVKSPFELAIPAGRDHK